MLVWPNTISDRFHYRTAVYETRTYGGVRGALRQFLAEPSTRLTEYQPKALILTPSAYSLFYAEKPSVFNY